MDLASQSAPTAAVVAVVAFLVSQSMVGLLAAFFRVSGLHRNGLIEPDALGRVLEGHLDSPRRFTVLVGTLQLAATAVGCAAAARWAGLLWPALPAPRFYVLLTAAIVVLWSLGGALARLAANAAALNYARAGTALLTPLAWLLRPWTALLVGLAGKLDDTLWGIDAAAHLSAGEIRSVLQDEDGEVNLEEDEREMIRSIFGFHETTVKEIMIPRIDVVSLDAGSSVDEAVRTVVECRHSRIPLHEGGIDKVTGLLYAKDLLTLMEQDRDDSATRAVGELARPAYFVPESKKLDEVLEEFRAQRVHMAVVIDEYGGTAGLVTLEDVLEEIVGEIEDEFDEAESLYEWLDDRSLRIDPKMDLDDLREVLGVELPLDEGSETLAGLVYEAAGRVPEAGDAVDVAGLRVVVEKVEDQRILEVRLTAEETLPGHANREGAAS